MRLRLGLKTIRPISVAAPGAVPVPSGAALFMDGIGNTITAPIIGQRLFINPGPFTQSPTSYDYQVYAAGVALADGLGGFVASGDASFIPGDSLIGLTLVVKCHGINAGGPSATTSDSAATAALVDIDLSADAPVLTRTSASGATPYTVDAALGSKTFADYTLHRQLASDNGFGTILYDGQIVLTEAMLQAPLTIDWTTASPAYSEQAGSQYYERQRVEAFTPLGVLKTSPWSNTISKTDAIQPVVLNVSDKTSGITLTNGALTGTGGGGSIDGVRATRGISTAKSYWEVNVDNKAGGTLSLGAADSTQSETAWWGNSASDLHGFGAFGGGSINGWSTYPAGPTFTTADRIDFAVDGTARKMWMRKASAPSTWYPSGDPAAGTGGMSISGITGNILPGHQSQSNTSNACTYHFATASFIGTPPTGFTAI